MLSTDVPIVGDIQDNTLAIINEKSWVRRIKPMSGAQAGSGMERGVSAEFYRF